MKTEKKQIDMKLNQLHLRYIFNRDIGDVSRANYWLNRIKEHEALTTKNKQQ